MIEDEKIAREVIAVLQDCSSKLNESIRLVQQRCTDEEFQKARDKIVALSKAQLAKSDAKMQADLKRMYLTPEAGTNPSGSSSDAQIPEDKPPPSDSDTTGG